MDIWLLPHDFMYPEFCHHQNETFITIFLSFCATKLCVNINTLQIFLDFFRGELLGVSVSLNFPFAVAGLSPLGTIVERRKRSPLEDPVKNGASFNDC